MADTYTEWGKSLDPAKLTTAIGWWQRLVDHDPADLDLKAAFVRAREDMRAGMTQWEAAALASPDDSRGWLQVARGYLALGDDAQASPAARRAIAVDPGNAEARALLASLPA